MSGNSDSSQNLKTSESNRTYYEDPLLSKNLLERWSFQLIVWGIRFYFVAVFLLVVIAFIIGLIYLGIWMSKYIPP